jgi:hypothetical protein
LFGARASTTPARAAHSKTLSHSSVKSKDPVPASSDFEKKDCSTTTNGNGARGGLQPEESPLIVDSKTNLTGVTGGSLSYNDKVSELTLSRKLALILSQYSWYCPGDEKAKADLIDAWAYFEHSTLPRYFIDDDTEDQDGFPKAEPGEKEKKTKLYPVLSTPETDLADFGIGVGVYFFTLRLLSYIMLFAGIMSLPNLYFYGSDEYNAVNEFSWFQALRSSAVCTDHDWEACPTCTLSQWDYFPSTSERYAEAKTDDGTTLKFTKINNCYITRGAGVVAYVTMLFVCLALYVLAKVSRYKEVKFDEASRTTTDYSVEVVNPPKDAKDVDEWKEFFAQFGHVCVITVALDNEELLQKLIERRSLVYALEKIQPLGVEIDLKDIASAVKTALPVPCYWKLFGTLDAETIQKRIASIDEMIDTDLSKREYGVSNVFVIFVEEKAQQNTLQALQVPALQLYRNNTSILARNNVFRGKHLLHVMEPTEPSSVRWQDLDESFLVRPPVFALKLVLQRFGTDLTHASTQTAASISDSNQAKNLHHCFHCDFDCLRLCVHCVHSDQLWHDLFGPGGFDGEFQRSACVQVSRKVRISR